MCPLGYLCTHATIALQGASQINSVTCGSWAACISTLANGVPFRHMYSVFALDTFIPPFSKASLHCSSSNSSSSFSLAHSTTSSANIICQGACFLMFSVSESIIMAKGKGWKRILGRVQLPLHMVRLFLQHTSLQFRIDGRPTCHSPVWCTSLAPPCLACTNTVLPSELCRRLFPDQWIHSVSLAVLLCIFLAAVLAQK